MIRQRIIVEFISRVHLTAAKISQRVRGNSYARAKNSRTVLGMLAFCFSRILQIAQCPTWAFFYLLNDPFRGITIDIYPGFLSWIEYTDQTFPAPCRMLTNSRLPDNSDLSITVLFLRHDRFFETKLLL